MSPRGISPRLYVRLRASTRRILTPAGCTLQLTYRQLRTFFKTCFEYNNRNGYFFTYSHFSRLGKWSVCELRFRRSPTNAPLQPTCLFSVSDSLFVGRLFDFARLPKLRKDSKPANVARTDPRGWLFRVPLAIPFKSSWDSPGHGRAHLFWNHYRHRS